MTRWPGRGLGGHDRSGQCRMSESIRPRDKRRRANNLLDSDHGGATDDREAPGMRLESQSIQLYEERDGAVGLMSPLNTLLALCVYKIMTRYIYIYIYKLRPR